MLGPALFGPCRYIAASSPLVATLDSLLRSSVIMKTRTWGSTFMYLPSSLSLANESWDLLISPSIFFFSVTNLDSRPRPRPSPSPASRLLFAPPAQAYTRCTAPSLPRVEKKGQEPSLACPCRPRDPIHLPQDFFLPHLPVFEIRAMCPEPSDLMRRAFNRSHPSDRESAASGPHVSDGGSAELVRGGS